MAQIPDIAFDFWSISLDIIADVDPVEPFTSAVRYYFNKSEWDVTYLEFEEIVDKAGF